MREPLTTSGRLTTVATSASTKHAEKSSTLRAELERLSGHEAALALVIRDLDQRIGRLADSFVAINWWGEEPGDLDPEDQRIIDLLNQYDAELIAGRRWAAS